MTVARVPAKDNYGNPGQDFVDRLSALDDAALERETEKYIWLSSYAGNNPRSDFHWQCDACWDECEKRGQRSIYERAYKAVERQVTGR